MSEAFTFSADGEAGPFFGPADVVVGDSETFGSGTLTVELDGGTSRHSLDTLTAGGVIKVNTSAAFYLDLSGSTSPDLSGLIVK